MSQRIAYSTWAQGRQGNRIARAHVIISEEQYEGELRYKSECRKYQRDKNLLRPTYLKFVDTVDDLPKRVMPCTICFKCCDVPYWQAVAKKGYQVPKYKQCSNVNGCGKRKTLEEFARHPTKKWGRDSICRECLRERNKYYPRRSDTKSVRITPNLHNALKQFAHEKGMGIQEAAVRALRLGMESMCRAKECTQPRARDGWCEGHYRAIVKRIA